MCKNLLFVSFGIWVVLSGLSGCQKMVEQSPAFDLDEAIGLAMEEASGGVGLQAYILPESDDFASIPQDPRNPINVAKVDLGKKLFHETRLGIRPKYTEGMYTYSCASCHHVEAGFQAGIQQGIGEGGLGFGYTGEKRIANPMYPTDSLDVQPVRSPSALNIAYQTNVLWNGQFGATHVNEGTESRWTDGTPIAVNKLGYEGTETQAIAGLTVHRMDLDQGLIFSTVYKEYFDHAFAEVDSVDRYSKENAGLAIAAYERTLLANHSPFQRWLKGEKRAMSDFEKRGALLFFGEANCVSCHNGPALNSMEFYALGMRDMEGPGTYGGASSQNPANLGRGGFTGKPEDNFKFKVPQLYNLKDSPFYGHGGTFHSVREIVEYKNRAVSENQNVPASQLAPGFIPLHLTDAQINQITGFLERSLYDPHLDRYVPVRIPSGFCFPNNDESSRHDMGCN
ncbi:MAG: cytochrome c peroxidase [Bacteroidia bacterium]